jgi:beta-1,4-mannooligosaccharide/beta-1,4-mannosyl-N-acetylglucosamine phosphorylase
VRRHPAGPILTRADVPDVSPLVRDVSSVFNPGAIRLRDRDLLLLRVQTRGRETVLMAAESDDGVRFEVRPRVLAIHGLEAIRPAPFHVYDPRLTRVEDRVLVVASADTEDGCRLLVARLDEDLSLHLIGFDGETEARNGVLFPERIGGRYCRLERPNRTRLPSGTLSGDSIRLSTSEDLVHWSPGPTVLTGRFHYWDELIGSGPPPLKTRQGWLHVYHGVATHLGGSIYQAGACLLDLEEPWRVVARGRNNVLEPREPWEMVGQVPNVVFPTGALVDRVDAEGFAPPEARVRIYYGAADTCVGLAETTVRELLEASRLE